MGTPPNFYVADYKMSFNGLMQGAEVQELIIENIPGLGSSTHKVESINNNILGAFQINFDWSLKLPKKYPK